MLTSEATVDTDRAGRYLEQLCRHAAAMGTGGHRHGGPAVAAERSADRGVLTLEPWGRCVLHAGAAALTLRVEAADADGLRAIQDIVTRDLERFGRRDGVAVRWS